MVSLATALAADRAAGTYNNRAVLRAIVLSFLAIYLGIVFFHNNSQEGDIYTSPEGLKMTVSSTFPTTFMRVHYWGGVLLVPLTVLQKQISLVMPLGKQKARGRAIWYRPAHKYLGYVVTALVCFMAFGGYSLRFNSTFENFESAMVLFVAPWIVFVCVVPLSAYLGWGITHVIAGDALFKACVAVPLARCLGVALQRYMPLSSGYYIGILSSSIIIGAWAIVDMVLLLRFAYGKRK